ncbi:MipA/OmpV family protein [Shewanella algae]|uniref:MipA/OmpV family protein n=1 Tax=Shewanella algae TaxID=38313 RepID=UPI00277B4F5C|nr:MipA/OmpV family protein [Shewanella algae]
MSYLGGVSVTWVTPYTDINLGLFQDISGVHDGNELQLRLKKSLLYSWGALGFELGAIRKSESLVRYYYQLTPEESGPLRLSYTPRPVSTITPACWLICHCGRISTW